MDETVTREVVLTAEEDERLRAWAAASGRSEEEMLQRTLGHVLRLREFCAARVAAWTALAASAANTGDGLDQTDAPGADVGNPTADEAWQRELEYIRQLVRQGPMPGHRVWRREDLYERGSGPAG